MFIQLTKYNLIKRVIKMSEIIDIFGRFRKSIDSEKVLKCEIGPITVTKFSHIYVGVRLHFF